ncbi:hypothetical protein PISMIDRAFT_89774 [Pisolithus microcarpus 441]|uniref:Uncharacterized protein n=1 Tax=Pisolithus microcarpus 441 TaxID=765257 RepID=A0A0C9ZIP0_9AGAM|nr:hypothetical protein PISMIDRAFT_89774 [Pisolithus microcarpus 441]
MDYKFRGDVLKSDNVISFFLNSYEVNKTSAKTRASTSAHQHAGGRPCHNCVDYQPGHSHAKEKHRILRRPDHHNLPNFIGQFFPSRDDPEQYPFYCTSMLLLLKPWRDIGTDLKRSSETWERAFKEFLTQAPPEVHHILSGIQYFHQCEQSAQEREMVEGSSHVQGPTEECSEDVDLGEMSGGSASTVHPLNELDLADLISSQIPRGEEMHGRLALEAARFAGIFPSHDGTSAEEMPPSHESHCLQSTVCQAEATDFDNLCIWQEQMSRDVHQQNTSALHTPLSSSCDPVAADVYLIDEEVIRAREEENRSVEMSEAAMCPVDLAMLNVGQTRAYQIVTWHVDQTLSGRTPPPLRMLLHGEGGTGKSKVIQTISEYFTCRGACHLLLKAAYTGVAASLIDRKTTHTIAMVSRGDDHGVSAQTKAKLQQFWQYLIIDEMSMIGKSFLAKLSRIIAIGKMTEGTSVDATLTQLGHAIYEEFQTVVILKEQMHVTDDIWRDFLNHLQMGCVEEHHIGMLRQLVLTNPAAQSLDFSQAPWSDACLVTPQHAVRHQWNDAATCKHAHVTGALVYKCTAEDTVRGAPLTLQERYAFAL